MCTQRRFRSACVFTQSEQNLYCALFWIAKNAKFLHLLNLFRLCGYAGSFESLCAHIRVPTFYVLSRNMKNIRVFHLKIFNVWRWNFLYIWIGVFSCVVVNIQLSVGWLFYELDRLFAIFDNAEQLCDFKCAFLSINTLLKRIFSSALICILPQAIY